MNNDPELLRSYVETGSEPAFTELVQRHVRLVYAVALRRVGGDSHLAEDVTQRVFGDFARKASSLLERPTLSGWFHTSTLMASAGTVRSERRRKARETEAHLMQTTLAPSEAEADWTKLRPVIDDAIEDLKVEDREAVMLRYFEQCSFADIGAVLRVTEDAARKRVDRALDKLRVALVRRGVTSTPMALGVAFAAIGTTAVPNGLAAKVASHAFIPVSASAGTSTLAVLGSKLWPAAAALVVGAFLIIAQRQEHRALQAELAQLSVENQGIHALREDNVQLARAIAQMEVTELAPPVAPERRRTVPVNAIMVNIGEDGSIAWNNEYVSYPVFIAKLQALPPSARSATTILLRIDSKEGVPMAHNIIREASNANVNGFSMFPTSPNGMAQIAWF